MIASNAMEAGELLLAGFLVGWVSAVAIALTILRGGSR